MSPSDRDDQARRARLRRPSAAPDASREAERVETPEVDAAQQAFGNAALTEWLGSGADPGNAALRALRASRRQPTPDVPAHGGDPDPVVDGPITEADLRPGAARRRARPDAPDDPADPDPDLPGGLPPEDDAWLEGVRAASAGAASTLDGEPTPEASAQPSGAALREGLGLWIAGLRPWLGDAPTLRLLAAACMPPAACLQDPHGRAVLAHARVAAIGAQLVAASGAPPGSARLTAELAAARPLVARFERDAARAEELPSVLDWIRAHLPDAPSRARDPGATPPACVRDLLARHVGLPSAGALVPSWGDPAPSDDDPLGLDRFLDDRPAPPAPDDDRRRGCLAAAERLAVRVSASGARLAATAVALARAAAPDRDALERFARRLDTHSQPILRLLLEVADACRADRIPASGLRNGLRRAAHALDRLQDEAIDELARMVAADAALAGPTTAGPAPGEPDPLDLALAEGRPEAARPWVAARPDPRERAISLALLDVLAPAPYALALDRLEAACAVARDPHVRVALEQLVSGCLIWLGRAGPALDLAAAWLDRAARRRDGALAASATLLAVEAHLLAGDARAARDARDVGGRMLAACDAPALTLLARWRPPEPED